jgi:hypothetical protein
MKTTYEWIAYDAINDVDVIPPYWTEKLYKNVLKAYNEGLELILLKYLGDDDGRWSVSESVVKNKILPDFFDNGTKVPKRFFIDFKKKVK